MAVSVGSYSGPVIEPGIEKAVHIIFIPPEVEADPGPNVFPTEQQLAEAALTVPDAKQTDVIVFKGKPWHMVNRKLEKHPHVHDAHPGTVLELIVDRQKAVWWSEHKFKVKRIVLHKAGAPDPAAPPPPPPPSQPFPEPATVEEDDAGGLAPNRIHVARSIPPRWEAKRHEYKVAFERDGRTIDPNMRCT